jgi:hypothetical protein
MTEHDVLFVFGSASFVLLMCGSVSMLAFGLITVRRLRKLPEVNNSLGWQPLPGFGAFNAAAALTDSRTVTRVIVVTPLRRLFADREAIYRNTAPWERRLARFAYLNLTLNVPLIFVCASINRWGVVHGLAAFAGVTATALLALAALPSALTVGEVLRVRRVAKFGRNKVDKWWDKVLDDLQ